MKPIKAYYIIETKNIDGMKILRNIEKYGRVCYKSEDRITDESCKTFVKNIIERGHESVLEHESLTVKFIYDRGLSHEQVRHRLGSYSQESSRYCNYNKEKFGNEVSFIDIYDYLKNPDESYIIWWNHMQRCEKAYFELLEAGEPPEIARSVLPNSLKTEIVVTYNLREWRHFFKLRANKKAHPQMRKIANRLLNTFKEMIPIVFDDIEGVQT